MGCGAGSRARSGRVLVSGGDPDGGRARPRHLHVAAAADHARRDRSDEDHGGADERWAVADVMATLARQTVGVMGSGTSEHDDLAREVGALLATLGVNLLTGGGPGVMRAVGRAYLQHRRGDGMSIGILPCASERDRATARRGYPNEFVELAIRTHLPFSGPEGTHDL